MLVVFLLLAHWCTPTANASTYAGRHAHGLSHTPGMSSASVGHSTGLAPPPPYTKSPTIASSTQAPVKERPALLVNLNPSNGDTNRVTIAAVHPSLLVLDPEGCPLAVAEALHVGDEILSIDGVPAWQLGAEGVQAVVREADTDTLRITVRRNGDADVAPLSLLMRRVDGPGAQVRTAHKGERRWDWTHEVGDSPDAHAVIAAAIERRCHHLRMPALAIAETLDVLLPREASSECRDDDLHADADEQEGAVVERAVDRLVKKLTDGEKQAILEEAFGCLLAVAHSRCWTLAPILSQPRATLPRAASPRPALHLHPWLLRGEAARGAAQQEEQGRRLEAWWAGGLGGASAQRQMLEMADRMLRCSGALGDDHKQGAQGQQAKHAQQRYAMALSARVLEMLTLTLLYGLWPDAQFPPLAFPLNLKKAQPTPHKYTGPTPEPPRPSSFSSYKDEDDDAEADDGVNSRLPAPAGSNRAGGRHGGEGTSEVEQVSGNKSGCGIADLVTWLLDAVEEHQSSRPQDAAAAAAPAPLSPRAADALLAAAASVSGMEGRGKSRAREHGDRSSLLNHGDRSSLLNLQASHEVLLRLAVVGARASRPGVTLLLLATARQVLSLAPEHVRHSVLAAQVPLALPPRLPYSGRGTRACVLTCLRACVGACLSCLEVLM
jgi:hypothetical protein